MEKSKILEQYHLLAKKEIKDKKKQKQGIWFTLSTFLIFIVVQISILKIYGGTKSMDTGVYFSIFFGFLIVGLIIVNCLPIGKLNEKKMKSLTKALILKDIQALPTNIKEAEIRIEEQKNVCKEFEEKLELLKELEKEF